MGVPLTKETYICAIRWITGIRLIRVIASRNPNGSATIKDTIVTRRVIDIPDRATKNVSIRNS